MLVLLCRIGLDVPKEGLLVLLLVWLMKQPLYIVGLALFPPLFGLVVVFVLVTYT